MNSGERRVPLDCGLGSNCCSYRKAEAVKTLSIQHTASLTKRAHVSGRFSNLTRKRSLSLPWEEMKEREKDGCEPALQCPKEGRDSCFVDWQECRRGEKDSLTQGRGVLSEILEARSWLLVDALRLFLLPRQKTSGHLHPCVCTESLQLPAAAAHTRTSQSPIEN